MTERARARIGAADPAVGVQPMTFLLCHNWGNEAAQLVDARYRRVLSWVAERRGRELKLIDHKEHLALAEDGRYLWCDYCQRRKEWPCSLPTSTAQLAT